MNESLTLAYPFLVSIAVSLFLFQIIFRKLFSADNIYDEIIDSCTHPWRIFGLTCVVCADIANKERKLAFLVGVCECLFLTLFLFIEAYIAFGGWLALKAIAKFEERKGLYSYHRFIFGNCLLIVSVSAGYFSAGVIGLDYSFLKIPN